MYEEMADADASTSESAEKRIDALERALSEAQTALAEMRSTYQSLHDMLMHARTPICMWQGEDFVFTLVNPTYSAAFPGRQLLGKPLGEALPEAVEQGFDALLGKVYRTGQPFIGNELPVNMHNPEKGCEEQRWYNIVYAPVCDATGKIVGVCHYGVDITEQVQARHAAEAKAEELRKSAELIAAQKETIRVLSTPLLPLAPGVLAAPLIGAIDARRSEQLLEVLLDRVAAQGTTTVILDVTGVETIDMQAANALIQAAQAVRLLGARVMVTGIQPSMAQVLVQLGVDLRGIATYGTLQSGIAAAMGAKQPPRCRAIRCAKPFSARRSLFRSRPRRSRRPRDQRRQRRSARSSTSSIAAAGPRATAPPLDGVNTDILGACMSANALVPQRAKIFIRSRIASTAPGCFVIRPPMMKTWERPLWITCLLVGTTLSCGSNESGTGGSSASSGSAASGSGGAGGQGGGQVCAPGTTMACYSGPAGTEGKGACKAGVSTCSPEGSAFGPCAGEVQPGFDDCTTPADEDCDGAAPTCTGSALWAKLFGDAQLQDGARVAADATGNVLVGVAVNGAIDLGGGALTNKGLDVVVAKLAPDGSHVWSKIFGDASPQYLRALEHDGAGGLVVAGQLQGALDFGGGPLTAEMFAEEIFVARLDGAGKHLWSRRFPGTGNEDVQALSVDAAGNVVLVGCGAGGVDFGMGAPQGLSWSSYVAKLSPAGETLWAVQFPGSPYVCGSAVAIDAAGNVLVAGTFQGTVDLGAGPLTSAGGYDAFVLKLDSAGKTLWALRAGDAEPQGGTGAGSTPRAMPS